MNLLIIILLIVTGIFLFAVEFLLIPGITIAGIGGFLFIAAGIYFGYAEYGTPIGHYIFAASLVLTASGLYFMLRGKTWKRTMLNTNIEGKVPEINALEVKIGDHAITTSRLAPIGKIKINDTFMEAKSQSGFIDQKTEVEIVKVFKTNVIVKPVKK
ncbi:NfeD family protein [Saccharicrinis sp. FJH62]|uniref:NfeD family protein n=1 Tax=Saccharicrinis sp. FJH62 TaxID=3344657 RepID=UPI0035D4EB4B